MSKIPPFKLEEFWKTYEFSTPHLLCPSDAESWSCQEMINMADPETAILWDRLSLGYTESPGLPLLRKEIAKLYQNFTENNILTFAGAEEGIYCAMHALVAPNDHVIVVAPSYQSLGTLPQVLGAKVTWIPRKQEHNWQILPEQIQSAWRPETKLFVFTNPDNPTGQLLEEKARQTLVHLAQETDAWIFCDEVYSLLEIKPFSKPNPIAASYSKGISLNVMTKSFGLAGLRIGWLACQNRDFLEQANAIKMYTSICNSAPSEILALIALRAKKQILDRNQQILHHNLQLLQDMVKRHPQSLRWVFPQGGTVALMELLLPCSIDSFAKECAQKAGVLIMPGSVFDLAGNFFRVGFGRKNMGEALQHFEKFLDAYESVF